MSDLGHREDHALAKARRAALKETMEFIEAGGRTVRCHTIPCIQPQNVAAHSAGVAWWCVLLSEDQDPSPDLLIAALQHDLAEHITGDIPSPIKDLLKIKQPCADLEASLITGSGMRRYDQQLDEEEARILRVADGFELMQHCVRERTLGNRTAAVREMFGKVKSYVRPLLANQLDWDAFYIMCDSWSDLK